MSSPATTPRPALGHPLVGFEHVELTYPDGTFDAVSGYIAARAVARN